MAPSRFARFRGRCSALEVNSGNSILTRTRSILGTNLHNELNRTLTAASLTVTARADAAHEHHLRPRQAAGTFPFLSASRRRFNGGQRRGALRAFCAGQRIRAGRLPSIHPAVIRPSPLHRQHRVSELVLCCAWSDQAGPPDRSRHRSVVRLQQPYYLRTGITASIGQQIYGPLDVQGRVGGQRLAYRERAGSVAVPDRQDKSDPTAAASGTGSAGICASGSTSISRSGNRRSMSAGTRA